MSITPVITTPSGDALVLRLQALADTTHREFLAQVTRREAEIARHKSAFHRKFLAHTLIVEKTDSPPSPPQPSLKERFNAIRPAPLVLLKAPVRPHRPVPAVNPAIPEIAPVIDIPSFPTTPLDLAPREDEKLVKYEENVRSFSFRRLFDRAPRFGSDP